MKNRKRGRKKSSKNNTDKPKRQYIRKPTRTSTIENKKVESESGLEK